MIIMNGCMEHLVNDRLMINDGHGYYIMIVGQTMDSLAE